jgi:hypothetical protein
VPYDSYEPVPPFTFVGLVLAEDRKGNPLRDGNGRAFPPSPRAVDGRGVSVPNPELDIWRWCAHADAEGDFDAAERVRADWAGQLAAAQRAVRRARPVGAGLTPATWAPCGGCQCWSEP